MALQSWASGNDAVTSPSTESSPRSAHPTTEQRSNDSTTADKSEPAEQVFEVALDGSKDYQSIHDALNAARDPETTKVILIHPGTYQMADNIQIRLDVSNTHLEGTSRDEVKIIGAVPQEDNANGGLIKLSAPYCSIRNLSAYNTARQENNNPYHANVVNVGNYPGGADASNCEIVNCYLESKSEIHPEGAHDTIYALATADNLVVRRCHLKGDLDVLSNGAPNTTLKDSVVDVNPMGGEPFWTAYNPKYLAPNPTLTINNVETRGANRLVVFDHAGEESGAGKVSVRLHNVYETLRDVPELFIATPGSGGTLYVDRPVMGVEPDNFENVEIKYSDPY